MESSSPFAGKPALPGSLGSAACIGGCARSFIRDMSLSLTALQEDLHDVL
jgi:hypothetical protein